MKKSVLVLSEPDVKRILHGFAVREQILGLLCNAPRGDAIGAAVAFLVEAAKQDPAQMRAVLQSVVDGSDGTPVRIVEVLTRASR